MSRKENSQPEEITQAKLTAIERKLDRLLKEVEVKNRRYLTIADAAVYSDLSEESIRRLLACNKLKGLRPVSGRVLIDRRELDALILSCDRGPRKGRGMYQRDADQGTGGEADVQ